MLFRSGRSGLHGADSGYLSVKRSIAMWEAALHMTAVQVSSRTWQKAVLGEVPPGESKDYAIQWCRQNAPDLNLTPGRCYRPHDGLADARCIAEWARVHMNAEPKKKGKKA